MNWKRLCFTMSLSALCVVYNALSVDAQTCDPNLTYPNNPPGPEGGCGDYEDCNENGAFDIGEPCHEHHDDDGEHHDDDGEHHGWYCRICEVHFDTEAEMDAHAEEAGHLDHHGEPGDHGDGEHHDGRYCRICDIFYETKEEMNAHAEEAGHLDHHVQTCDPNLTYPNNPPGSEGGCGDYEDCNENGAFDIGEPCHEHHADDD